MKKILLNYFAVIILILFIIYNFIFYNLKIGGLLYQIFMINLIIANIFTLVKCKKDIKCKSLVIIIYFFIWLFSKNYFQCFFALSTMITLIIIGFMESNFIKVISILMLLFFIRFWVPILFICLLLFGTEINEEKGINHIFDDMHYYCENNFEVYSYSLGAMDSFHYSIGKHYEFLSIDDIIYISYNKRNEVSKEDYDNYLKSHSCRLVSDKDGFE